VPPGRTSKHESWLDRCRVSSDDRSFVRSAFVCLFVSEGGREGGCIHADKQGRLEETCRQYEREATQAGKRASAPCSSEGGDAVPFFDAQAEAPFVPGSLSLSLSPLAGSFCRSVALSSSFSVFSFPFLFSPFPLPDKLEDPKREGRREGGSKELA